MAKKINVLHRCKLCKVYVEISDDHVLHRCKLCKVYVEISDDFHK